MEKNTYIKNGFVSENKFRTSNSLQSTLPNFIESKDKLPQPFWMSHEEEISMYWKAWEIGFSHLKNPTSENGFISSYLDTAYNGNIFMWDSVFITHFSRYGRAVFPFQKTLDNFYKKQHLDGFICREIYGDTGQDAFQRHDPTSTGPNLFAWSELEYYKAYGDIDRLNAVFPVLCGFHFWLKENRTWQNGSYWSSGWGSGMDNIPRMPIGKHASFSHGHMSWVDTCIQQYINAKMLLEMGFELERWQEIEEIEDELTLLGNFIVQKMWDSNNRFLFDIYQDETPSTCKHIGAFWALHTDLLNSKQLTELISHLEKDGDFNNLFMIPSLSRNHPNFRSNGRYWQGGIWAPTNYMVLTGLQKQGHYELAFSIAEKVFTQVLEVYKNSHTFYEYYSPTAAAPGLFGRPDFIGWTGLVPISILFEIIFGINANFLNKEITWNLNLTESHGIKQYPFGSSNTVDLLFHEKENNSSYFEINTVEKFKLTLTYKGRKKSVEINSGKNMITLLEVFN